MRKQKHLKFLPELEQRVLENLMDIGDPTVLRIQKAFLELTQDCFYNYQHAEIFLILKDCFNRQDNFGFVDVLVLLPKDDRILRETFEVIMQTFTVLHVNNSSLERDIEKLLVLRDLRKQFLATERALQDAMACQEPIEAQKVWQEGISTLSGLSLRSGQNLGVSHHEQAEAYYQGKFDTACKIKTSSKVLNDALGGGFVNKSLITIAANSSRGKTNYAVYLADLIGRASPEKQILFFSLEMEAQHIFEKNVGVRAGKIFSSLSDQERTNAIASCLDLDFKTYDATMPQFSNDIDFICTTAHLAAIQKPISVVVVDYLGLVSAKGDFERHDLRQSYITTKLSQLAIKLNCIVIALSQVNRNAENRAHDDQCPYPGDAADSSGSYRSSNYWFGCDRPELYTKEPHYKNKFILKARKNRFGDLFELVYDFNHGVFSEPRKLQIYEVRRETKEFGNKFLSKYAGKSS